MVKQSEPPINDEQNPKFQPIKEQHNVFNRKKLRKAKKEQKKLNHIQSNQQKHQQKIQVAVVPEIAIKQEIPQKQQLIKKKSQKQRPQEDSKEEIRKKQLQQEIEEEDKMIENLAKKLKLKSNRLTKTQIQLDGYEDDLFDFLDHVDKQIKLDKPSSNYKAYQQSEKSQVEDDDNEEAEEEEEEELNSEDSVNENKIEEEEDEDIDENTIDENDDDNNQGNEEIEDIEDNDEQDLNQDISDIDDDDIEPIEEDIPKVIEQKQDNISKQNVIYEIDEQYLELQKQINRNINKLSETNINSIVDSLQKIFESNPKQIVSNIFAQSLISSTVKAKQLLPYLLSCLTATSCYFHQLFDNFFFAEIIKQIILTLKSSNEISYKKNITLIFCHWYIFESISLEFIKEYIDYLCLAINADTVENLINVVLYCGKQMRNDNPAILKSIIDQIKAAIEIQKSNEDSRTSFLLMTLNDLKMNKKINSQAERLEFIINWQKQRKSKLTHKLFPVNFTFCLNSEFQNNHWWSPIPTKEQQTSLYQEFFTQKKNQNLNLLEQLAQQQKMVTETRKNIFIIIMGADDLYEATQNLDKIGYLKKKKQDVAMVIVEMCGNEKTYNAYYTELAHQLVKFEKGMKQQFQYALWDKFKLIENYELRKQLNIAQFISSLLKKESLNLIFLKWFDFNEINDKQIMFLNLILHSFLQKISMDQLGKQSKNLFEKEDHLPFRTGLQNFLKNNFKMFLRQYYRDDLQIAKDAKIMIKLLAESNLDEQL